MKQIWYFISPFNCIALGLILSFPNLDYAVLFAVILQVSTVIFQYTLCACGPCVGIFWAMVLIDNAKQAKSKKWSGWNQTNLTGGCVPAIEC